MFLAYVTLWDLDSFRQRDVSLHAVQRKAAEDRLDQLVDMYGDPAVNEELRSRLPHAGKDDIREIWQHELDDMMERERRDVEKNGGR